MDVPSLSEINSAFQIPDRQYKTRNNNKRMSSIVLNTRFGLRAYTIKPDSPRTKQALIELGIDKQDFHLK